MSDMWSETTPVTVLPELERMLVLQASLRMRTATAATVTSLPTALTAPSVASPHAPPWAPVRRRWRIPRRSTALALLALFLLGSAIAAVRPWSPLIGNEHTGHPTISQTPPAAASLRLLGVLRRGQAAPDRDAQVQAVLHIAGPRLHGVKEGWIRNLESNVAGRAVALVPVETYGDVDEASAVPLEGGFVCVVYPFAAADPGASLSCWSPAQIESGSAVGRARGEGGLHVFGLVPDGVASVTVAFADGRRTSSAVHANFFDALEPAGPARAPSVRWRDAGGRGIGPPLQRSARHEERKSP